MSFISISTKYQDTLCFHLTDGYFLVEVYYVTISRGKNRPFRNFSLQIDLRNAARKIQSTSHQSLQNSIIFKKNTLCIQTDTYKLGEINVTTRTILCNINNRISLVEVCYAFPHPKNSLLYM